VVIKPAEKLTNVLRTRVVLERASSEQLKLGGCAVMNGIVAKLHQFHLIGNSENKFVLEYGVAHYDFKFELSEDEAFDKLADKLGEFGKVQFHLLWLPVSRGLEYCTAHIHDNVIMRVIEFYEIRSDEILTRYDILVSAID
jgi:hypothetical protein